MKIELPKKVTGFRPWKSVNVSPDTHRLLAKLAEESGHSMGNVVGMLARAATVKK